MNIGIYILIAVLALVIFGLVFLGVYALNLKSYSQEMKLKRDESEKRLAEARKQSDETMKKALKEAKELAIHENREFEKSRFGLPRIYRR